MMMMMEKVGKRILYWQEGDMTRSSCSCRE